ncbi:MAG: peptidylprolyl isomerase [Lachnospiraceae bacterium]|nr:peptidylprolyl isomerase [Lachnospiraceae bacterium]
MHQNKLNIKYIFLCMLVICTVFVTACGKDSRIILTTGFDDDEIFRLEGVSCYKPEVMVYLTTMQNQYESAFGEQIWKTETGGITLEDSVKQTVLARLAKIKMMNLMAASYKLELTKEQEQRAVLAAANYYSSLSDEEKSALGNIKETDICTMYKEYALADSLYDYLTSDVNVEISDDEARTITVEQIKVSTYDEAQQILRELRDGASFDELAMSRSMSEDLIVSFHKGDEEEAKESACFNLGEKEVSLVVECADGYYIFKCLNTLDREKTDNRKAEIQEQRRQEAFDAAYNSFMEGKRCYLNEDAFEAIEFVGGGEVDTMDFFDVYEQTVASAK